MEVSVIIKIMKENHTEMIHKFDYIKLHITECKRQAQNGENIYK